MLCNNDYSYVSSWIDTREVQSERANLTILFDKYVPVCLDTMKTRFKKITPIADIAHIQVSLLEKNSKIVNFKFVYT